MQNFIFQNTTKLIFGKGSIASLANAIPSTARLLLVFGGGSVRTNGVYDQVIASLSLHTTTEFWGIEPNPTVETIRKAVLVGKDCRADYVLAIGGGSVLDAVKLIACAIPSNDDAWQLVLNGKLIKNPLPFASVMTLPATGSEMNRGSVISNKATQEKFAFYAQYPQFSILDPETTFSLPKVQLANGIADTFVHVMEQYLTTPNQSLLMDRWAEGILQVLVEIVPSVLANNRDYDVMSQFMLAATMALNGFISMGVSQDWATHMIGHELTALHGIDHAQSLAIVLPGTMKVLQTQKAEKILQYGARVWGILQGDDNQRITKSIEATEMFFRSLGLATRLSQLQIGDATIMEIEKRFMQRNVHFGEARTVTAQVTTAILNEVR